MAAMSGRPRSAAIDAAVRLVQEEGLSQAEAARRAGCSQVSVWKRLNPEKVRAWDRRANARPERRAQKRAWDNTPMPCPRCGGDRNRYATHCRACEQHLVQLEQEARDDDIIALWAEGASMVEIAREVGSSRVALGGTMVRIRRERGVDALPYRYHVENGRRLPARPETAQRP